MNIVYASPLPQQIDDPDRFLRPPLAAGYLASYASSHRQNRDQHDIVTSLELAVLSDFDAVATRLLRSSPGVIAFSVYVWNRLEVREIASRVRMTAPEVAIVLGGPDVAYTPLTAFREIDCDWICTGEGEIPFLNLLNSLESNPAYRNSLPGLLHRDDADLAADSNPPLVECLDEIPSPYLSGHIAVQPGGWVDLETTRGCPFRCRFCLYGKTLDTLRHFSTARIEKEIAHALANSAANIYLMDPTFNYPSARCLDICEMLARLNAEQQVCFSAEVRAELVGEAVADAFVRAGLRFVEVGLQSSNRETLKLMHRGLGTTSFIQGCHLLRERGIHVDIGVIVGLPGDDADTLRRTVDFVLENGLGRLNIYRLQVLPGSEYHKMAGPLGLEYYSTPPYYVRHSAALGEEQIIGLTESLRAIAYQANAAYNQQLAKLSTKQSRKHDDALLLRQKSSKATGQPPLTKKYTDNELAAKTERPQSFRHKSPQLFAPNVPVMPSDPSE